MPDFDPAMLPPRPNLIPPELSNLSVDNTNTDWKKRVPPQAVGMVIAAFVRWLSDPRFGTKVDVNMNADGWTINIGLNKPVIREDVLEA